MNISTQIWTLTSCARLPAPWFPDLTDIKQVPSVRDGSKPWRPFFSINFLVRGIICRHSLVAWLHKMGLWQFQFSELCCVQMCFQKVWTSNWMFLGSIVWCVRTPVIMCTHVVCLWQWSAKWLAWFSFYVSLCIQASHYFLNTSLVWYSLYTGYWLPQIYEKKLYFSNGCFNPFWIQYRLRLWLL